MLAYHLTGSVAEAERIGTEEAGRKEAETAYRAYQAVVEQCLAVYEASRSSRAQYFGEWLPEPLSCSAGNTGLAEDANSALPAASMLSYAKLAQLELLNPEERAVFVLTEAFELELDAISKMMRRSEAHCRLLLQTSGSKLGVDTGCGWKTTLYSPLEGERWIQRFLAAAEKGRLESVLDMLAEEVVCSSDGGGKVFAPVQPITERERVACFLIGLLRRLPEFEHNAQVELMSLNGESGVVVRADTAVEAAFMIQLNADLLLSRVFIMRNPDKLQRLKR